MAFELFWYALFSASLVTIWKKLVADVPMLGRVVDKLPYVLRTPLMCGLCLSYWTSLLLMAATRPLFYDHLHPAWRFGGGAADAALHFLFVWFILGFLAWSAFAVMRAVYHSLGLLSGSRP